MSNFFFPHNVKTAPDNDASIDDAASDDGIVVVESNETPSGEMIFSTTLAPTPKSDMMPASSTASFNAHTTKIDMDDPISKMLEEFRQFNKETMTEDLLPLDDIVPAASTPPKTTLGVETANFLDDLENIVRTKNNEPSPVVRHEVLQAAIEEVQEFEKQQKAANAKLEKLISSMESFEGLSLSNEDLGVIRNLVAFSQETKDQNAPESLATAISPDHTLSPNLQDESDIKPEEPNMMVVQETTAMTNSSDFPFETLASVGRSQMKEQTEEEPTTQQAPVHRSLRGATTMVWSLVSGVYRILRAIVATTWWSVKSIYQATSSLLRKMFTSQCLVVLLTVIITSITTLTFVYGMQVIQQVLVGIVPTFNAEEEQGDTLFVTSKSEPIIVSTESGYFATNDNALKSNESMVFEDPSDITFEDLTMFANFLGVMFVVAVSTSLFSRRPDDDSNENAELEDDDQANATTDRELLEDTSSRPPNMILNKSTTSQKLFEAMTTPQLREACKKRDISAKAIKEDTVRLLCIHDGISHSFPTFDLSNYTALTTKQLQQELKKVKPEAPMSGSKDDLRYRLVVAREELFKEMTCSELRNILKQHYMITSGLKKTLTNRLAEAGPSVQVQP